MREGATRTSAVGEEASTTTGPCEGRLRRKAAIRQRLSTEQSRQHGCARTYVVVDEGMNIYAQNMIPLRPAATHMLL